MKSIASVAVAIAAVLTAACGSEDKAGKRSEVGSAAGGQAAPTQPYAGDIEKLCNVVTLSGADQVPYGERALPIANWLAANLSTQESRQFLVHIQPLVGDDKANALEAEAKRVGLAACALAAEWRNPG